MNQQERKYLVKRINEIANSKISQLNSIKKSKLLPTINRYHGPSRELLGYIRKPNKTEILKVVNEFLFHSNDSTISAKDFYNEEDIQNISKNNEKKNEAIEEMYNKKITLVDDKCREVSDTAMLGSSEDALKMMKEFIQFCK